MRGFVGRRRELEALKHLKALGHATLLVVKGRRRIGKSRLLNEFGKSFPNAYIFSGLAPEQNITAQHQRDEFGAQLERMLGVRGIDASDWSELFWRLAEHTKNQSCLIVLDEITWMGDKDPTFLPKLKNAWDLYFSTVPKVIMALSGSLSAWIDKNILSSTGFLGRVSLELELDELPIGDAFSFWSGKGARISAFEKLKTLAVTGGVPRYLENVNPAWGAEENIRRLCFEKGGMLTTEFERIFSDLFNRRSETYARIVSALAEEAADLDTLSERIPLARGGKLSHYLDELVQSGFLSRDYTWNIKNGQYSRLSQYRLKDNYTRFYLKYVLPNLENIQRGHFFQTSLNALPGWNAVQGLQFENLVLANRALIHRALGIHASEIVCDNPFFQRKTARQKGCQIDYMIQTRHDTIYICEIKFSKNPIDTQVIDEVKKKISHLTLPKHFSYRPILIHANRISEALEDAHYFSAIINFTEWVDG